MSIRPPFHIEVNRLLASLVDDLVAAIVASTRLALGVFVGERGAQALHDGPGGEVLRGDELNAPRLTALLLKKRAERLLLASSLKHFSSLRHLLPHFFIISIIYHIYIYNIVCIYSLSSSSSFLSACCTRSCMVGSASSSGRLPGRGGRALPVVMPCAETMNFASASTFWKSAACSSSKQLSSLYDIDITL